MRAAVRSALLRVGLYDAARRARYAVTPKLANMVYPPYARALQPLISESGDPVRYTAIALAAHRIATEGVVGSVAEVGVYKGDTSRFLRRVLPWRPLHLFDTFEGFPEADLDRPDGRFRDTGVEFVAQRVGTREDVVFHRGYFPETAAELDQDERFAFVLLDLDLYAPMKAGLEFFYPRMSVGGYLILHDYNNPESDRAVSRAADPFFADKPESLVDMGDRWGSVLVRKV